MPRTREVVENACQKERPESESESKTALHLLQKAHSRKRTGYEVADYSRRPQND